MCPWDFCSRPLVVLFHGGPAIGFRQPQVGVAFAACPFTTVDGRNPKQPPGMVIKTL